MKCVLETQSELKWLLKDVNLFNGEKYGATNIDKIIQGAL